MSLTNYQKVADEFNTAFGVQNNTTPQLNLYDSNPNLVAYRSSLINEEVDEFNEAVKNKDFKETIDALTDMLYMVLLVLLELMRIKRLVLYMILICLNYVRQKKMQLKLLIDTEMKHLKDMIVQIIEKLMTEFTG